MEKQKSAILQMFYGERGDGEKLKCSAEYREYLHKAGEYGQKLYEKIKDNQEILELFKQYDEWTDKAYAVEIDAYYQEGFKFGLLIGVEAGESKFE